MIAATENTLASERYNAVDLLRSISPHIKGGVAVAPRLHKAVGLTPMAWTMRSMLLGKRWASITQASNCLSIKVRDGLSECFFGLEPGSSGNFLGLER